jgi:hypothetical protein
MLKLMLKHFSGKWFNHMPDVKPMLNLQINLHSNKPFNAVPGRGAAGAWVQVGGVWQCYTPPILLKSVLLF